MTDTPTCPHCNEPLPVPSRSALLQTMLAAIDPVIEEARKSAQTAEQRALIDVWAERMKGGVEFGNEFLSAAIGDLANANVAHFEHTYGWKEYMAYERRRDAAMKKEFETLRRIVSSALGGSNPDGP